VGTDLELLCAWRSGDKAAGEQLFERHFDAIARFFRNKVDTGIEDLVQRTFLGCVEAKDRFRAESSFRTYLFGIAHNVLGKHYRSKKRDGERIDFGVTSVYDMGPSPSTIVARHREQMLLLNALRRIPLDYQIPLELFYWEHMTAAEIGQVVGVPEGTAKTRLRRARQLLEEQMRQLAESPDQLRVTVANLENWAQSLRDQVLDGADRR
jgi:RNA polymerase sigma-70 factor (ECF subfamily)